MGIHIRVLHRLHFRGLFITNLCRRMLVWPNWNLYEWAIWLWASNVIFTSEMLAIIHLIIIIRSCPVISMEVFRVYTGFLYLENGMKWYGMAIF